MTITELSKELRISKPAILKHLTKLMDAGLVKKIEGERKWVYYSLTFKGKHILHPERVKITLLLSTSFISIFGAVFTLLKYLRGKVVYSYDSTLNSGAYENTSKMMAGSKIVLHDENLLYMSIFLWVVFISLISIAIYVWKKRNRKSLEYF